MWNKKLRTLDNFSYHAVYAWFRAIWALFPQTALMPTTQKTVVTQSLGDLCRRVRPYLMWKVELCLGVFLHMTWGTWVQFLQIYLMTKYPKAGITQPNDSVHTRLTSDRMWNMLLKICINFCVFQFLCCNGNYWTCSKNIGRIVNFQKMPNLIYIYIYMQ